MKNNTVIIIAVLVLTVAIAAVLYAVIGQNSDPGLIVISDVESQGEAPGGNSSSDNQSENDESDSAQTVPLAFDFTAFLEDGASVRLSDYFGKPTVINFWATSCPLCVGEMGYFEQVYSETKGSVNVLMVNLTNGSNDTKESAKAFIVKNGYSFPVLYDTAGSAASAYNIYGIPATYFISASGKLVAYKSGTLNKEGIEKGIALAKEADASAGSTAEYKKISPSTAKAMMDSDTKLIILDVRTKEEYEEKHIPGAVLIPDYELSEKAASMLPDKNAIILVYCRSGRRSAEAAKLLVGMGYNGVLDFGGIIDWEYETVSGE